MKKNLSFFTVIVAILLFSGCQKEYSVDTSGNTPAPGNPAKIIKVKSYTEAVTSGLVGNSLTTYNLSYDASDRVVSIVSASNPGDKFLFTFPSATLFTMDLYNSGSLSIHQNNFLNSNQFIDSTFQYNDTKDSSTEKYIYNTSGQLVTLKEYTYSKLTGAELDNVTTYTYDGNGDMIGTTDLNSNIVTYEYYPDLSYAQPYITGSLNANSLKKNHLPRKGTFTSNGILLGSFIYTYTFDSENRISTEKAITSDGSIVLKTYTYY